MLLKSGHACVVIPSLKQGAGPGASCYWWESYQSEIYQFDMCDQHGNFKVRATGREFETTLFYPN